MTRTTIILLLFSNISFGQTLNRIDQNFDIETNYKSENILENFDSFIYDFSTVWTQTENQNILGIIGDDHLRVQIRLISVSRISNSPFLYNVYGKSKVRNTICEFYGNIVVKEIREVKKSYFGPDDEYMDKGIKTRGVLIADYEFHENKEQKHSGIFKGKLYSKWYLISENQIKYDDIEFISDGYTNNAFVGIWKSHLTGKEKNCNWADYRVPITNKDFDIGAGEFSPNEKYFDKGWAEYEPMKKDEWWK